MMGTATDRAPVARVRAPERSVRHDVRAVKIVLHRELIRLVAAMGAGLVGVAILEFRRGD
ncbi:hypothetical protein ACFVH6_32260 [Spirillospora sp. NPDC127200]